MRLRERLMKDIRRVETGQVIEPSGGVYRLQTVNQITFRGIPCPPKRRTVKTLSGVRLADTWRVLTRKGTAVSEKDYVYLPGDPRAFVITGLRNYPAHMEIDLELLQ